MWDLLPVIDAVPFYGLVDSGLACPCSFKTVAGYTTGQTRGFSHLTKTHGRLGYAAKNSLIFLAQVLH